MAAAAGAPLELGESGEGLAAAAAAAAGAAAGSSSSSSSSGGTSGRVVNDPIHGHVRLPPAAFAVMDTPQFQRLRDLKQMGTSYLVFPGASHNRFEHCVGVAHLADTWARQLRQRQGSALGDVTDRDVQNVMLAGLAHDLGHGPFSHTFEGMMARLAPQLGWEHEHMSLRMLDHLIDANDGVADIVQRDDARFVKELIVGAKGPADDSAGRQYGDKRFLFDIVANGRNSVDVDKFDYLARDCYNTGIKSSYDYSRLIEYSRVIDNQICFHAKEAFNLYELFHTRYSMHKQVYTHRVGRSLELMLGDALVEAEPTLGIVSIAQDCEAFTHLTDSIRTTIESWGVLPYTRGRGAVVGAERTALEEHVGDAEDGAAGMRRAQAIMKRIQRRDLYPCCGERVLDPAMWPPEGVTAAQIFRHVPPAATTAVPSTTGAKPGDAPPLTEDDIIVTINNVNYAMKERNPVDNTRFYNRHEPDVSFTLERAAVSLLIPTNFQERIVRVYCRDKRHAGTIAKAFAAFLISINCVPSPATRAVGGGVASRTPQKSTATTPRRLF